MISPSVYFDYQSSTPIDPRVQSVIESVNSVYANPHSISHHAGVEAGRLVELARKKIAQSIGALPKEIIFTSGATEANNLAILGLANQTAKRRKIIVLESEHSSVLDPALMLRNKEFEVVVLPLNDDGIVDLDLVRNSVDHETLLFSVMYVNNETGVIQPIEEISDICHQCGVLLHSDCAQALGRLPVNSNKLGVDFLTLSSHKCYGPKGIGALYIRDGYKSLIKPLTYGGGQEGSIRPGTLPVTLCVGFGEACYIADQDLDSDTRRMNRLSKILLGFILNSCPSATLNGSAQQRVLCAFNISFRGATSDELIEAFEGIEVSSGSACTSDSIDPSRVLLSYGLSEYEADSSLRFSIGRFTSEQDVELAMSVIQNGLNILGVGSKNSSTSTLSSY